MKVYFDVDRTLLDTATLTTDLWEFLASNYGLLNLGVKDIASQAKEQYYVTGDSMYYYDFFAHLKDLMGDDFQKAKQEITKYVKQKDYLYKDARYVLQEVGKIADVELLSYGAKDFQEFKIINSGLDAYPYNIVLKPKGEFFANKPGAAILVDDKNLYNKLPPQVQFIMVDRTGQDQHANTVGSLTRAMELIKNMSVAGR